MKKILVVCYGNTCRSPMLMALIRVFLFAKGLADKVSVESAGTKMLCPAQPAAPEAIEVMSRRGICLHDHVSRYIGLANVFGDLTEFDRILCLDSDVMATVAGSLHADLAQLELVNEFCGGVPNPWQKGVDAYAECADVLESFARDFVNGIEAELALDHGAELGMGSTPLVQS